MRHQTNIQSELDRLEHEVSFKQLQINRLLTVTQSINGNATVEDLFATYTSILGFDMEIRKMLLLTREEEQWRFATSIDVSQNFAALADDMQFLKYQRMSYVEETEDPFLSQFDFIIPVYHKQEPIAVALLGDVRSDQSMYEKVQFIQTITNIITIAIENKRLFKRQLEQERLKKEMELARSVQSMLIPSKLPQTDEFTLAGVYMPHSGIGGDYYDFVKLNDHEYVFCIADISGKGIPAALLMSNFQANVQTLVRRHISPEKFIELLNKAVQRLTQGEKFITFFIARYHIGTRKLQYINAGHNSPIILQGQELVLLDKGCTILGAFDSIPELEVGELIVEKNALIVAYTDGLTDLQDPAGNYFEEALFHEFAQKNAMLTPHHFNSELVQYINEFRNGRYFTDDITILTCRV